MFKLRLLCAVLAVTFLASSGLLGDDKKDSKDTPSTTKYKGFLPQNWGKLGLSEKQKQDVYKTQTEYREKIDSLKGQIKKLEEQEKADLFKVLTDEQKARLKDILTGKAGETKTEKK